MPLIAQEAMEIGRRWGEQKAQEILQKLQEAGHQPNPTTSSGDDTRADRVPERRRLSRNLQRPRVLLLDVMSFSKNRWESARVLPRVRPSSWPIVAFWVFGGLSLLWASC